MNEALILRALERAELAMNDTIALYCPEFSRKRTVRAAQKRMAENGTLSYYADVLATIVAARDSMGRKK